MKYQVHIMHEFGEDYEYDNIYFQEWSQEVVRTKTISVINHDTALEIHKALQIIAVFLNGDKEEPEL